MTFARVQLRSVLVRAGVTVLVVNVLIALAGSTPWHVWQLVIAGTFGSGYGLGQVLAKAAPLILTGASFAFALRAGLFNLGAEGQLAVGMLACAVLGAHLPATTPALVAIALCTGAAVTAGALLGALAGWLRGRFGAHEVVTTLMLNGLVAVLTTYLYGGPLRVGEQVHTAPVIDAARIAPVGARIPLFVGTGLDATLVYSILAAVFAHAYIAHTTRGRHIRALGDNALAARALGIPVTATTVRTMAVAGGLAGAGAVHFVLGAKGFAEGGLASGVGLTGIAVALLGGGTVAGLCAAAVLFGALGEGGLVVNALVPADVLTVVQAVVLVAVVARTNVVRA